MAKKSFTERRKLVQERRDKAERKATRNERYYSGLCQFTWPLDYEKLFPLSDDERRRQLEVFARDRSEDFDLVVRMVGDMAQSHGLTFDEMLFQHEWSGWSGPQTVSERQRQAAYKAWETMRARKAAQQQ